MNYVTKTDSHGVLVFREALSFDDAMKEASEKPSSDYRKGTVVGAFNDDGTLYGVCGCYRNEPLIEERTQKLLGD